jgi:hypothetical protein
LLQSFRSPAAGWALAQDHVSAGAFAIAHQSRKREPALVDKDIMVLLALNAMSCNMKKHTQTGVMDDQRSRACCNVEWVRNANLHRRTIVQLLTFPFV